MRLWHQDLLPTLPNAQLIGQHRECCALRGNGWGRPHSTVQYVFQHSPQKLVHYHRLVMMEMLRRGNWPNLDVRWFNALFRGKTCAPWSIKDMYKIPSFLPENCLIYSEHNDDYMEECINNLKSKEAI